MPRNINEEDVHKRIQDWESRIDNLYRQVREWLHNSDIYESREGIPVIMYQEVMMYFSIPTRELPTLDILSGNHLLLTIKPVALWLVGGNGRLDLLVRGRKTVWYLVDRAQPFDTPDWRLFAADESAPPVRLTPQRLLEILDGLA